MDGKRGLVQIALELKTRGLDELLVLLFVGNLRHLPCDVGAPHPLQVDVKIAVRPRKQSGRFGRGVLAQHDYQGNGGCDQHHAEQNGESTSYAHEYGRPPGLPVGGQGVSIITGSVGRKFVWSRATRPRFSGRETFRHWSGSAVRTLLPCNASRASRPR